MGGWTLPERWEWKSLPEICQINPKRPRIERDDSVPTSFVPMQAVDEHKGAITDMQIHPFEDVKRGYTYFEENDVLMAKITPSMENGKAAIARNLLDGLGFGTTEFHVFRPKQEILPDWIFHFIRRKSFREDAKMNFRGAVGQQRVPEDFLYSQQIPVPYPDDAARSLAEQKRIVARLEALLGEVRGMREDVGAMQEDLARVMESALGEVFPNVIGEVADGWKIYAVEEISTNPQYGYTASSQQEPVGPKFLRITDIQNGFVDWDSVPYCQISENQVARYELKSGDIVFARSGATTGKTYLIKDPPKAVFASYLIRIRIQQISIPEFVFWFFQSPQYWKQITLRGGAQPNMNAQLLKKVRVPIPHANDETRSLAEQKRIVGYLENIQAEIQAGRKLIEQDEQAVEQLEQSILAAAFRGEV